MANKLAEAYVEIITKDTGKTQRRAVFQELSQSEIQVETAAMRRIGAIARAESAAHADRIRMITGEADVFDQMVAQQVAATAKLRGMGGGGMFGGATGGANRFQHAMLQASFGVQDFLAVYGTTGLRGSLMASANNWSQVAAIISPMGGAIAGLAITLGTVLVGALASSNSGLEKQQKLVDDLSKAYRDFREEVDRVGQAAVQRRRDERIDSSKGAASEEDAARDDAAAANARIAALRKKRDEVADELQRRQEPGLVDAFFNKAPDEMPMSVQGKLREEKEKELQELEKDLEKERKVHERASARAQAMQQKGAKLAAEEKKKEDNEAFEKSLDDEDHKSQRFSDSRRKQQQALRDLEGRMLEESASEVESKRFRIARETEERMAGILESTSPGEERDRLMGMARSSAQKRLSEINQDVRQSGQFTGLSGLGDIIQQALGGDDMKRNSADTAKNTAATAAAIEKTNNILSDLQIGFGD